MESILKTATASLAFMLATMVVPATFAAESPYVGEQLRDIKALSQADVEAYLSGAGMGYAKAAELNHYPGPKHVLELADQLELSGDQFESSRSLFQSMQQRAKALGRELVEKERALDLAFGSGSVTDDSLRELLMEIAQLESVIRYTHLKAHLAQRDILSDEQVELYDRLRGYDEGKAHQHDPGKHH
jgi:hypothetical protein